MSCLRREPGERAISRVSGHPVRRNAWVDRLQIMRHVPDAPVEWMAVKRLFGAVTQLRRVDGPHLVGLVTADVMFPSGQAQMLRLDT